METRLILGDSLEELDKLEENSIDSIVTDPPYELNFMGKGWDNAGISFNTEIWSKCLRVLKPGGHLLAFGGSRTYHRIAVAIEDAGFEIRDTIMWLYGSGFPKSQNIGLMIDKKNGIDNRTGITKQGMATNNTLSMMNGTRESTQYQSEYEERKAQNKWEGWGSALKPAFEPIIVARKPFKGSLVDNVIKWGVGGLNIDECRVETNENIETGRNGRNNKSSFQASPTNDNKREYQNIGRFPANLILTYEQMTFDEVCGGFPNTNGGKYKGPNARKRNNGLGLGTNYERIGKSNAPDNYGDSGSACRYFYCAKASKKDRDEGLDMFEEEIVNDGRQTPIDNPFQRGETPRKNIHPTVKPTELMQYLVRLVTPDNGTVLDCFMGSGSTGKAAMYENLERNKNYSFIGIEREPEYYNIAKARIEYVERKINNGLI